MTCIEETILIRSSSNALADFDAGGPPLMLKLEISQTGQQIETLVPATAVRVLADVLARIAEGQSVTLISLLAELSTQQAADLLYYRHVTNS